MLADRCVAGLEANEDVCLAYAEGSPSIVTPLNRHLGYDEAAAIAKQALASEQSIRAVVVDRGHVDSRQAHRGAARRGPGRPPHDPPLDRGAIQRG